jgi:hypothetical protein
MKFSLTFVALVAGLVAAMPLGKCIVIPGMDSI